MPRYQYISSGSNTTIVSGVGRAYGVVASGASGGSIFLVDSIDIGATPNYVTQISNSSNLAHIGSLSSNASDYNLMGIPFQVGLTVAATSNASVTVIYDAS